MSNHPSYQLLPALSAEDFTALKADIRRRGVLVPIERDGEGVLLDGHHRVRAIEELRREGVEVSDPPVIVRLGLSEAEKRSHVRSINLLRRHLTASQRRAVIEEQLRDTPGRSDRAIAHALSVSPTTVGMVRRRLGERLPTVQNGQSSREGRDGRRRRVPSAKAIMAADDRQARRAVRAMATLPNEVLPPGLLTAQDAAIAARIVHRETAREARLERLRDPGDLSAVGRGTYRVLLVDPPWTYTGASDPTRSAERHYPLMTHDELLALPVGEIAARSAVLFLWATPPKLAEAVALIDAWGFSYTTSAVWDKERLGLGSWFRLQHELLLVATRGRMPAPAAPNRCASVIRSPRGAHSEKPAAVRQLIERMFPGLRRIELFARGTVEGWDAWGLEADAASSRGPRRIRGQAGA